MFALVWFKCYAGVALRCQILAPGWLWSQHHSIPTMVILKPKTTQQTTKPPQNWLWYRLSVWHSRGRGFHGPAQGLALGPPHGPALGPAYGLVCASPWAGLWVGLRGDPWAGPWDFIPIHPGWLELAMRTQVPLSPYTVRDVRRYTGVP